MDTTIRKVNLLISSKHLLTLVVCILIIGGV